MEKSVLTEELNNSYNQLKKDLKEKYSQEIFRIIDATKNEVIGKALVIFGDDILAKMDEAENLKREIDKIKTDFYGEEKYVVLQNLLKEQKESLEKAKGGEAEKITAEMKVSLDKISTLNITLRNRLKEKREKLDNLNSQIEGEYTKNKDRLIKLKEDVFRHIKVEIERCLEEFNEELEVLNETFGVEVTEPEIPFDEREIKMELPFLSYGSVFEDEDGAKEKPYILSENNNPIKN